MTLEITELPKLRATLEEWRKQGDTIALVPTMGALHRGHLELLKTAQGLADRAVVSIFVNPTQFGPTEDFAHYPRPLKSDLAQLRKAGADAVWLPDDKTMYPNGPETTLHIDEPFTQVMEGAARPGHFDGVATVVAKLFEQTRPDIALFGEKDYQQLLLVKRLINKLKLDTRMMGLQTVREKDGLALSSRNAYLSAAERTIAPALYGSLKTASEEIRAGNPASASLVLQKAVLMAKGFAVDYLDYRAGDTLETLPAYKPGGRLFVAARLGNTRLIDNLGV